MDNKEFASFLFTLKTQNTPKVISFDMFKDFSPTDKDWDEISSYYNDLLNEKIDSETGKALFSFEAAYTLFQLRWNSSKHILAMERKEDDNDQTID
jgi:hypothetical protein